MTPTVAIIGCGATKLPGEHPARALYTGALFRAAVADVERRGVPWLVLSAQHGLVPPERVIASYDLTIEQRRQEECRWHPIESRRWPLGSILQGWLAGVRGRLLTHLWFGDPVTVPIVGRTPLGFLTRAVVEVHAGAGYVEALQTAVDESEGFPLAWETPLAGLGIGERLRWYAERRREAA